jgi:hypothetical protein
MAKKPTKTNPLIRKGRKSPMPEMLEPMLATLVNDPVEGDDWVYESVT